MRTFFITGMLMLVLNGIAHAQRDSVSLPGPADSARRAWGKALELKSVLVTARKPLIVQKADRTIVNVDALISNTGSNALEVLANTPGLQVDDQGAISLKGRTGVLVLIDGRPARFSGADLAAYLKSLPSGTLDRIELMSNPPASYQAAGTGGIINIITKKSKAPGFNGSMTLNMGAWQKGNSTNSLNLGYRRGKWSFSGNARLAVQNGFFLSDRGRNYTNPDGSALAALQQHFYESNNRLTIGGEIGIGYYFSPATVLELTVSETVLPYNEKGDYRSRYLHAGGTLDSSMIVNSHLTNTWTTGIAGLNFRHPLNTAGAALTANLDYYANGMVQHQVLTTAVYAPDNSLKSVYDLLPVHPLHMGSWSAQADYTTPLGKVTKLEAGWRTNGGRINSGFNYLAAPDAAGSPDSADNHFLYRETIHALYAAMERNGKHLQVKAGLRGENTAMNGRQQNNAPVQDTSFTRSYTNWFPSLFITWNADSSLTHQVFLSFARRINRPDYMQLNPAIFFFDKSTLYTGNPQLQPEFSYSTELSYVYKQNITTTLLYSDTRNLIMQTFQQQGDHFVAIPVNIGRSISRGINISGPIPIAGWWTALLYTAFSANSYSSGPDAAVAVNTSGIQWRVSVNNQLRFTHGWSAEISGFYKTRTVLAQSIFHPQWYINTTVQKKLWKDKAALTLGLRDVFYTRITRRDINTLPLESVYFINSFDTRMLSLSFTCRFGKEANKAKQKTTDIKSAINQLRNAN